MRTTLWGRILVFSWMFPRADGNFCSLTSTWAEPTFRFISSAQLVKKKKKNPLPAEPEISSLQEAHMLLKVTVHQSRKKDSSPSPWHFRQTIHRPTGILSLSGHAMNTEGSPCEWLGSIMKLAKVKDCWATATFTCSTALVFWSPLLHWNLRMKELVNWFRAPWHRLWHTVHAPS